MPTDLSRETDRLDPAIWKIISVAVLGSFLSQLDATIVNVSLSSLAVELHSSLSSIQWVTSGYLLALTLVLPLNGWLVDRVGAKALYLWCFSTFTLSSAMCAFAWSANSLIGFRVLQGMSGGLLAPMTQMMMARHAGKHMARVIGYSAVPILFAPILGPVIAGAILQFASWRWLFLVNLPVGALAVVLAVLFLPRDYEELRPRGLDLVGLMLLSPGLVLFLYGSDHLGERSGLGSLLVSLALLAAFFITATRKGDKALIDLRLFRSKVFSASVVTQFMANGIAFSGQMLIPIYLIRACGRSPSAAGWLLAPLGLGMMCCYPWMGTLTKRFGIREVSAGGAFLALVGTLPFLYLAGHGFVLAVLAPALFIRGIGLRGRYSLDNVSVQFGQARGVADGDDRSQYHPASWRPYSDDTVRNISGMEISGSSCKRRGARSVYCGISASLRFTQPFVCGCDAASSLTPQGSGAANHRSRKWLRKYFGVIVIVERVSNPGVNSSSGRPGVGPLTAMAAHANMGHPPDRTTKRRAQANWLGRARSGAAVQVTNSSWTWLTGSSPASRGLCHSSQRIVPRCGHRN